MRIALGVEYDGSDFHGWETQARGRTVQACLEHALGVVADAAVRTVCAGRTDAGVHARAQVAHFDAEVQRPERGWAMGANANLPDDACVVWARVVPDDFHARFSARCRRYRYVIENRPTRSCVARRHAAWEYRPLDAGRMHDAASHLVGEHDFSSFRAAGCQARTPVRTVYAIDVRRRGVRVEVEIAANAFLQHMVRNVVGSLLDVGAGKRAPGWLGEVLAARDRTVAGVAAPAQGLYLVGVDYPARFRLPAVPPDAPIW